MNLAQIQPKQSRTQSCDLKGKEQKQSETYRVKILGRCRKRWQNGITFLGLALARYLLKFK